MADLCWASMEPFVFPEWHYAINRCRGSLWYPAERMRMDPCEPARRWDLYHHDDRSPLLARNTWALEVRVYGPAIERQYRPTDTRESSA